jgi:hypothetical protein
MKPNYELDELLESPAQKATQNLLSGLPEETLSLAWRSQLNEKLIVIAEKPKPKPFWAIAWKPAAGLALASALALVFVLQMNPSTAPSSTATAKDSSSVILTAHNEGSTWAELGVSPASDSSATVPAIDDFSDLDLDTL